MRGNGSRGRWLAMFPQVTPFASSIAATRNARRATGKTATAGGVVGRENSCRQKALRPNQASLRIQRNLRKNHPELKRSDPLRHFHRGCGVSRVKINCTLSAAATPTIVTARQRNLWGFNFSGPSFSLRDVGGAGIADRSDCCVRQQQYGGLRACSADRRPRCADRPSIC
jgi:hypothetical protein